MCMNILREHARARIHTCTHTIHMQKEKVVIWKEIGSFLGNCVVKLGSYGESLFPLYALGLTSSISLGHFTCSGEVSILPRFETLGNFVLFLIWIQISQQLAALQQDLRLKFVARSLFYWQLKQIFPFELFLRFFKVGEVCRLHSLIFSQNSSVLLQSAQSCAVSCVEQGRSLVPFIVRFTAEIWILIRLNFVT